MCMVCCANHSSATICDADEMMMGHNSLQLPANIEENSSISSTYGSVVGVNVLNNGFSHDLCSITSS